MRQLTGGRGGFHHIAQRRAAAFAISIGDLAVRIKAMTGSASPIVKIPYDQAYEAGFEDMPRRVPDIAKIRALIGYEPTVELDEILTRVIASLRT